MPGPDGGPDAGPDQLAGIPPLNMEVVDPGAGSTIIYMRPPLIAVPTDTVPDDNIGCYVGDTFLQELKLQQNDGDTFSLPDNATVEATLTAGGELVSERAAIIAYGAGGLVRVQIYASDTSRSGKLALTVTVHIADSAQTFTGPFVIVRRK